MRTLKFAFRTLFKTPFVTAVAVISLALGIGANTAIYSLFEQMILRPLPVVQPERLVNLGAPGPKSGSTSCNNAGGCEAVFSYPMFRDLEQQQKVFTGIAAHRAFGANIAFRGQTESTQGTMVSGSYFPVLGLRPEIGRLLTPDDDRNIGANFVAVLGHGYWETRLGADPSVIGETIIVNGQPMTIVGVAPRDFKGTTLGDQPRVFVPISMRGLMNPGFDDFENRRSYWAYLFARLKPGVSIEQARSGINALYQPIINDVEAPLQEGTSEQTMALFRKREVTVEEGQRGQSSLHAEVKAPILLLLSITGIVLLIACANIANLLLARAASRSQEMSIRLSIGASRGQVLRQLLTEAVVLAVMGGVLSLIIAFWTLRLVGAMQGADDGNETFELSIRPSMILFTAALSMGTGLLFGLFPALHSTRPDLVTSLRANAGNIAGVRSASRFRTVLVTAQIALSMALLISAALFIKSLQNVARVDLGLDTENIVTFSISPELNGYSPARSRILFDRLLQELAALPGVTNVTAGMVPILAGSSWGSDVSVEGFEAGPDTDTNANFNQIEPDYFRTLGATLVSGREFTASDDAGRGDVAIVNEAFVRKFNLGRDALGKRMATGRDDELDIQIVGVVNDLKYNSVKDAIPPMFYMPLRQDTTVGFATFYVRTQQPASQAVRALPAVVKRLDPNLPVDELKTLPQQVRENVSADRTISILAAAFAALATLLAGVGLYGVLAYTVAQRTREIGVRMALGADAGRVRIMVLRHVGRMLLIGGVVGILAALGLGRVAGSLLYEVKGHDPVAFVTAILLLTLVAAAAGILPAQRATRVDPVRALRSD